MKHSPLPWRIERDPESVDSNGFYIVDRNGHKVVSSWAEGTEVYDHGLSIDDSDLKLILDSVNRNTK